MPDYFDNPFVRWLEEQTPEAFIYGMMPQKPTRGMQQFAAGQKQPILQRFQGELARRAKAGTGMDLMFPDWLSQNFDFGRQYRRQGMQTPYGLTGPMRFLW